MNDLTEFKRRATLPDPQAALLDHWQRQCAEYGVGGADAQDALTESQRLLASALQPREVMERHWPDAPASNYLYACFHRPFSKYGRPPPSVTAQRHQPADWPRLLPHSYVAASRPLHLPQVELRRSPLPNWKAGTLTCRRRAAQPSIKEHHDPATRPTLG